MKLLFIYIFQFIEVTFKPIVSFVSVLIVFQHFLLPSQNSLAQAYSLANRFLMLDISRAKGNLPMTRFGITPKQSNLLSVSPRSFARIDGNLQKSPIVQDRISHSKP